MFKELAMFNSNIPIKGIKFYLVEDKTFLIASLCQLKVLSSAVLGGDLRQARFIMNHTVGENYSSGNPAEYLAGLVEKMQLGKDDVIGLLTSVDVRRTVMSFGTRQDLGVATVCTIGLGSVCSALRPAAVADGIPAVPDAASIVVLIDGNLTEAAIVNVLITATEAKTMAMFQAGLRQPDKDMFTGAATDSMVIACTGRGKPVPSAGAATDLGFLVGRTVYRAVAQGIIDHFASIGVRNLETTAPGVLLN